MFREIANRYFEELQKANQVRAWNPDGTPLQATRETITGDDGLYLDANGTLFYTTPGTTYQRWVTDWQEVE